MTKTNNGDKNISGKNQEPEGAISSQADNPDIDTSESSDLEGLESIKASESIIQKLNKDASGRKSGFKKLPLYARILIIFFASLVGIAAIGAGVFYWYLNKANTTMNSMTSSEIENILTPVQSIEEPVAILILGRDSRDTTTDQGRADTIMLLYLNPGQKTATLLSIPRDTLVDIEGHGKDKINAAYAFGGEELMIKTVSSFLNAKINHFVTIDFDGFVKLIDELGGVDIVVDRPLIDPKS